MQSTSLAPLLSVTVNLDSCCIILLGPFHYFNHSPSLCLAQRTGLHYTYRITNVTVVFLIMGVKFSRFINELPIYRVFLFPFYSNGHGFIHLVTENDPNSFFL